MPANLTQSLDGTEGIRDLAAIKKKAITLKLNVLSSSSKRSKKVCIMISAMTNIRMFTMMNTVNRRTIDFEDLIFKKLNYIKELETFLSYPR